MAAVVPDPKRIRSFPSQKEFEKWLEAHHEKEPELWIKIHKKGSGLASITAAEALDVVLCFGWIDAIRKSFDEHSFLQRYTPRGKKSIWSQVNQDNVARLIEAKKMRPAGHAQIEKAKADGRWAAAYAPIRSASADALPEDLKAAIDKSPKARKTLALLGKQNLFSLTFRTNAMKTPEGRARKIETLVAMLERGEAVVPQANLAVDTTAKVNKANAKKKTAEKTTAKKATPKKR